MAGDGLLLDSVILIDHLNGHGGCPSRPLLLVTRNVKDFPPRRFRFVRVPYAL